MIPGVIACIWLGGIILSSGCSTTSQPNYADLGLIDVQGTLTLDGTPLSGVEIRFETPDEGIYSYGVTDASGVFRLNFDSRTIGIIPGKKRVIVVAESKLEGDRAESHEETEVASEASESAPTSRIPDCYGRDSQKFIDLRADMRSIEIQLKSDCSDLKP